MKLWNDCWLIKHLYVYIAEHTQLLSIPLFLSIFIFQFLSSPLSRSFQFTHHGIARDCNQLHSIYIKRSMPISLMSAMEGRFEFSCSSILYQCNLSNPKWGRTVLQNHIVIRFKESMIHTFRLPVRGPMLITITKVQCSLSLLLIVFV